MAVTRHTTWWPVVIGALVVLTLVIGLYNPSIFKMGHDSKPVPKSPWPATFTGPAGIEFVLIQPGKFQMGSKNGDDDERPEHSVEISKPFYLSKYEITQKQWQEVMGNNPSGLQDDLQKPVENVSWEMVQDFMKKLNEGEGRSIYRLPTEAEWEYAARAGSDTAYHFSDNVEQLGQYAWYRDNADRTTHRVGQKASNNWGLHVRPDKADAFSGR